MPAFAHIIWYACQIHIFNALFQHLSLSIYACQIHIFNALFQNLSLSIYACQCHTFNALFQVLSLLIVIGGGVAFIYIYTSWGDKWGCIGILNGTFDTHWDITTNQSVLG